MRFKNILITGGAGYCGSVLTPQLLDRGYQATVYDILYYGNVGLLGLVCFSHQRRDYAAGL